MKKIIIPIILIGLVAAGYVYYSSKQAPKDIPVATVPTTDEVITGDTQVITGNTSGKFNIVSGSVLGWKATKPAGFHTGTVLFTTGTVDIDSGTIVNGKFVLDMTSITLDDAPDNTKLLKEIKEDIFSATKYPTSEFVITSVTTTATGATVQGDLTIAGQTHPIAFPATIVTTDEGTTFEAAFAIDRRIWGLTAFEGIANDYIEYVVNLSFVPSV